MNATTFLRVAQIANTPPKNGKPGSAGIIPVSIATWWRWVKQGRAPEPIRLGRNVTVWRADEVQAVAARLKGGDE